MKATTMRRGSVGLELSLLVLAVVLGMTPWFSATVVGPAMAMDAGWRASSAIWMTLAVQLGFVLGSTASAVWLLADRLRPARLAAFASLVAALATALLAVDELPFSVVVTARIVAGAAMAGVYPPAIKLAAGWTTRSRGLVIGLIVGGTTLGSAMPHLLRVSGGGDEWRAVVLLAAGCAVAAAFLFAVLVREGPFQTPSAPFDPHALRSVLSNRGVLLATGGYLGHMWELYAMWSSIGFFFASVGSARAWPEAMSSLAAFATIAAGAVGSVIAGIVADRTGRSVVTIVAMALSGACCLLIGPAVFTSSALLLLIAILWGMSIVADSAQFSASVTEFAPPTWVGTAVTVQTALGFLLTTVTIGLVPMWSARFGWQFAYVPLVIGPLLGIFCMTRLKRLETDRAGAV
ncbi:MAG: MFS transporter [Gemmatimonadota bacterium]